MNRLCVLYALLLILLCSCGDSPSDDYSDSLTLGTGLGNRGRLTGTGDTFFIPPKADGILFHWALESSYDIGGGFMIAMLIEQKSGDNYTERDYIEYESLDERDVYYYIESFYHKYGTGSFRATVIVGIRRVASKDYSVTFQ